MTLLSDQEIDTRLAASHWHREDQLIAREWEFADFGQAMEFVSRVADVAETFNHHPDIHVHGWNHVRLELSTHSEGGLTGADFAMAARFDDLA